MPASSLDYFTFAILFILWLASQFRKGRSFLAKFAKLVFGAAILAIFAFLIYLSLEQYQVWLNQPLTKFLLPPYQSIAYFIFFSATRFFAPYLISLVIAILFLILTERLNRKFEERFFEPEEPYFGATALFLLGHPGWFIYFLVLVALYLFLHLVYSLVYFRSTRLSLYHLWLPLALFVILLNKYWFSGTHFWSLLSI